MIWKRGAIRETILYSLGKNQIFFINLKDQYLNELSCISFGLTIQLSQKTELFYNTSMKWVHFFVSIVKKTSDLFFIRVGKKYSHIRVGKLYSQKRDIKAVQSRGNFNFYCLATLGRLVFPQFCTVFHSCFCDHCILLSRPSFI